MTSGSIQRRLNALEARVYTGDQPPPLHPVLRLLDVLVAHYLGEIGENESLEAGMARGLGYGSPGDLRAALTAGEETPDLAELNTRWEDAMHRLFALKGAMRGCDGETYDATIQALHADMPERLRRHPFLAANEGVIFTAQDLFL